MVGDVIEALGGKITFIARHNFDPYRSSNEQYA